MPSPLNITNATAYIEFDFIKSKYIISKPYDVSLQNTKFFIYGSNGNCILKDLIFTEHTIKFDGALVNDSNTLYSLLKAASIGTQNVNIQNETLTTKIVDESGNKAKITTDGQIHVVQEGSVDTNNSSKVLLDADGVFSGIATETLKYALFFVNVYSDVASAVDGLMIKVSSDGINWLEGDTFSIPALKNKTFSFQPCRKYFKVEYTNGALAQSVFDLEVILKKTNSKASSHRIQDSIISDDDAELVKSVITAEDELGNFVNIRSIQGQTGNNLKVSVDQVEQTTNSLKTITYSHAELHGGVHFFSRSHHLLPKAGVKEFIFVTPNTMRWGHFTIGFEINTSSIIAELYESVTTVTDGTLINIRNRNRNVSDNNTLLIYDDPTGISGGTLLQDGYFGAGKSAFGGGTRDDEEIILKQNTKYLLRFTEQNIAACQLNHFFDWYEHTNLV